MNDILRVGVGLFCLFIIIAFIISMFRVLRAIIKHKNDIGYLFDEYDKNDAKNQYDYEDNYEYKIR
jgi:hypothetical protein